MTLSKKTLYRHAWRKRGFRRTRTLRYEGLESRRLLTRVVALEYDFRQDDITIAAEFSGSLYRPDSSDLRDSFPNSQFTSESAQVVWTSPKDATGFLEGRAEGSGRITVFAAGARRTCADYSFRDTGRVDFTIDASTSDLRIDRSTVTSTQYTTFKDRVGGRCSVPNPPASRFFGGTLNLYDGTFDSSDHTIAIDYEQISPSVN
ncbi:MAG: hypothetical protein ACC628_20785, partial [Pirellulaceae bacterium]